MIKQKLQDDQLTAMKAKDQEKLDTLRYILSKIKNKEIDTRKDLTDEEVADILRKQQKELKESIEAFEKGNRPELAAQYQKQLDLVKSYLPAEMTDEELKAAVEEIKTRNADAIAANPKALIGMCMKELKGKADSARILKILNG